MKRKVKFVDLFAGMGGFRLGFENGFRRSGFRTECVLTSEIKTHAITALKTNFPNHNIQGDLTKIDVTDIPDFNFLLAGFPCQSFSTAGKREGFADTRGTLFFEVERILKYKRPYGFILENVEGLINHDTEDKGYLGRTLKVILDSLTNLGYQVSYQLLNAQNFGLAQIRKRVFIVGTLTEKINLQGFPKHKAVFGNVMEHGMPIIDSKFTRLLLKKYGISALRGKAIKDKRGGDNNIHSWDIGLKGDVSEQQKNLMELLFKERRKKHWHDKKGIKGDGIPLTIEEIATFYDDYYLQDLLDDLVAKGYLVVEHPKEKGLYVENIPKGYNIVAGTLSYEFAKIISVEDVVPTLVASDISKLAVLDTNGLRRLTVRECLRLQGFPDTYVLDLPEAKCFDLLGNTVAVPIVEAISKRLATTQFAKKKLGLRLNMPVLFKTPAYTEKPKMIPLFKSQVP